MKGIFSLLMITLMNLLSASPIPQYQISAINGNVITFSNGAVLTIYFKDFVAIQKWDVNDSIEIVSTNGFFVSDKVKMIEGRVVFSPTFLVHNISKNDSEGLALLEVAPALLDSSTFLIVSIDLSNRVIELNDGTRWHYPENDSVRANFWKMNDRVMMGRNTLFPSIYDAILLNGDQQSMIAVFQE